MHQAPRQGAHREQAIRIGPRRYDRLGFTIQHFDTIGTQPRIQMSRSAAAAETLRTEHKIFHIPKEIHRRDLLGAIHALLFYTRTKREK